MNCFLNYSQIYPINIFLFYGDLKRHFLFTDFILMKGFVSIHFISISYNIHGLKFIVNNFNSQKYHILTYSRVRVKTQNKYENPLLSFKCLPMGLGLVISSFLIRIILYKTISKLNYIRGRVSTIFYIVSSFSLILIMY